MKNFIKKNSLFSGLLILLFVFFIIYLLFGKINYEIDIIDFINLFLGLIIMLVISIKLENKKDSKLTLKVNFDDAISYATDILNFMKETAVYDELDSLKINEKSFLVTKLDNKIFILIYILGKDHLNKEEIDNIKDKYYEFRKVITNIPKRSFKDTKYQNECYKEYSITLIMLEKIKYQHIVD